jgi:diguanylate cyclase (GGDEF)-like protein
MIWQQQSNVWKKIVNPIKITAWLSAFVTFIIIWRLPIIFDIRRQIIILLITVVAYSLFVFYWLLPRYGLNQWLNYSLTAINVCFVAWAYYLFGPYGLNLDIVWVVVVMIAAIIQNWTLALAAVLLSSFAYMLVSYLQIGYNFGFVLQTGLHLAVFIVTGYLSSSLAEIVRQQIRDTNQRNQSLSFLLGISQTITTSLDLEKTLPSLAEQIARGIPVTFCRISLLEKDKKSLRIFGVYPLRSLTGWETRLQQTFPLDQLYWHSQVIASGQPMMLRQDDVLTAIDDKELKALFFKEVKSACLVPLITEGNIYGVISIGEARSWERAPFTKEKLDLLQTLAVQVAMVVQTARLHQTVQQKAAQLEVLNEVAKAVGSTIELESLIEMIYQQVSRIILADTYIVSEYITKENCLIIRMLVDEGERFPPQAISGNEGFSSIVVKTRQPVLLNNLSNHTKNSQVKCVMVGKNKSCASWLGVPMIAGGNLVGLISVSSYQENAFTENDQALLLNVANQAAIAVDNARHHASVEDQAHRDSLTGVYNHGYFLECLEEEINQSKNQEIPLSLIMLDIDLFKEYNDRYGHVIGDEVLRLTVQAIRTHIKTTDIVGRWGGEEFGVILTGATTEHALQVAERIRQTLLELPLKTEAGLPLVKPTVSQGIATFPEHCVSSAKLVICADQALYQAKDAGRDQVRIAHVNP